MVTASQKCIIDIYRKNKKAIQTQYSRYSSNHKREQKGKERKKTYKNKPKTFKKMPTETYISILRRRQWHPTPVLLPGGSHGRRSLVGCSPWGRWESDTTERLHFHFSLSCFGEGNGNPLVSLTGESQGWGSLVGCHPRGRTESDTTEAT